MNNSSPRSHVRSQTSEIPDTLVAVVTNDLDLRRFLNDHIYRIPERSVGRTLAGDALESARTLAVYQSSRITEGLPSAIEWWADIERIESVRRREIFPDEPEHPAADELYHLLHLQPPRQLASPLRSRGRRRIIFLRTTRERLLGAEDIADLPLGTLHASRLADALTTRLKGQVSERPFPFDSEHRATVRVDDLVMEVESGVEQVECRIGSDLRGRIGIVRFSPVEVENNLEGCVGEIMRRLSDGNIAPG